ncbi:MAG TPA: hypothetical protein VIF12_08630 [Micavibrio sp.]|jgi:hypothetical protein
MQQGLTPEFNKLSRGDRLTLVTAAFMKEVTGIMRRDVQAHPWIYPFYILPAICMTVPGGFVVGFPLMGYMAETAAHAVTSIAVAALGSDLALLAAVPVAGVAGKIAVDHGLPWAQRIYRGMAASVFNKQALVRNHVTHILPDSSEVSGFKLDKSALTKTATRKSIDDLKEATLFTWYSLHRLSRYFP